MRGGNSMTGREAAAQVQALRKERDCFVKWWRTADDLVDFELIDPFLAKVANGQSVDGFELLDQEGMWRLFTDLNPDQVTRTTQNGEEIILWKWQDGAGQEKVNSYPFTPAGLKALIDNDFFA